MCEILNPTIAAISGLGGVFLGAWLSNRNEREKRRVEFITRQLSEFYGPLVSLRAEIRARGELRVKIETAIDQIHVTGMLEAGEIGGVSAVRNVADESTAKMVALMRDEYKIFTDITMPLYRKMLEIFREKMWLAEPGTRDFLPSMIEFVDVWERHIRGTMPGDVIQEIKHTEENLHPFYDHLIATHDQLRSNLST